ncbi:phosphotransferase [uncultured Arthrobacter sp.]|uniref:phosphotransferase n=1 Tax=uncultured Arthrobacter sp. TaxID=114050 RepID=UPI00261DF4B5|nr:phosphotransferase [uncultured Arthrobacter sp.]
MAAERLVDPEIPRGRDAAGPGRRRILREQDTIGLLGSRAPEGLLRSALAAAGWELTSWAPGSLHHRPGAGVTRVFSIATRPSPVVCGGPSAAPPSPAPTTACITSCHLPGDPSGVTSFPAVGGSPLALWLHPADPLLPGLPSALDPRRATAFAFGGGARPAETVLRLRAYRPLRRAVVLARNGDQHRYLKVLRAGRAAPLAHRHALLHEAGVPAPVLAADPLLDVVAMHPVAGHRLAVLLLRDGAAGIDPGILVRTLASLPASVLGLPARPSWADRVRDYGEAAVAALPAEAHRIRLLAQRIDDVVRASDAGPLVPTHGDFHGGNVFISGTAVSALLDLDTLGPGHLVDDLACCVGHLAVLPGQDAGHVRVAQAVQRFLRVFDESVDPVALRSRAAAVVLTLVAGARRRVGGGEAEALSRLAVAERLLAEALSIGAGHPPGGFRA